MISQLIGVDLATPTADSRERLHNCLTELDLIDLESMIDDLLYGVPAGELGMFGAALRAVDAQQEAKNEVKRTAQRVGLAEGVVRFLKAFADQTPTLLVIDDLHQENAQALYVLKHVLDEIKQAKLVIVVTYEPTINLDLDVQSLTVPDLNKEETDQVALAILHSSELGPRLKTLLWERSSGRPLFIEALLRKLLQAGYIDREQGYAELKPDADLGMVPDDVRELVVSRVDSLPPQTQGLLRGAAVLIEDFTAEALLPLSEINDLVRVQAIIDDLCRTQILEKLEPNAYRFRHGLTQSVIYESLSRAQRLKVHRIAVDYWRAHPEFTYQPVVLAYHLMKCGLLPAAIEVVTTAAQNAEASGDLDRAVELYAHALTIFPDDHSISGQIDRLAQLQRDQT